MDLSTEKAAVMVSRRCQRNWDLQQHIPEAHIDHWIYVAQNAPSKQDLAHFNITAVTDRTLIDQLLEHT
jgi:nitroreductase